MNKHEQLQGHTFEITNPGALRITQRQEIIDAAQSAFGQNMSSDEILEHLTGRVVVATDRHAHIIGFGAMQHTNKGLYLSGAAVHKDHQHTGAYRDINRVRLGAAVAARLPVYTRTQNFKVEQGVVSALDELRRVGKIAGYTLTRVHERGAYGRMLTEREPNPPAGSPYRALNYQAGDAYLLTFAIQYR